MPRAILAPVVAAIVLSFFDGFVGVFGLALIGALATAFGLQGLASLHARTLGKSGRLPLLILTYLLMLLSQGALLVIFTLLGLIETAFAGRVRASGGPGARPST